MSDVKDRALEGGLKYHFDEKGELVVCFVPSVMFADDKLPNTEVCLPPMPVLDWAQKAGLIIESGLGRLGKWLSKKFSWI